MSLHEDPDLWSPAPLCGPKSVGKMWAVQATRERWLTATRKGGDRQRRWRQLTTALERVRASTRHNHLSFITPGARPLEFLLLHPLDDPFRSARAALSSLAGQGVTALFAVAYVPSRRQTPPGNGSPHCCRGLPTPGRKQ